MASTQAIKRLMKDQEELVQSPVMNVSAMPLDNDMFEWHCNIKDEDNIYHIILYFPTDYPYKSPSAEFVPSGLNYNQGAIKKGKKGDQICLSIFSDFANIHREWAGEAGTGWSPGYTAQTVLLNLVSFLAENDMTSGSDAERYQRLCRRYTCSDCGHTFDKPFPPLNAEQQDQPEKTTQDTEQDNVSDDKLIKISSQIVDYVSKEKFDHTKVPSQDGLFGYGLVVNQRGNKKSITTPCEFLTAGTFYGMQQSSGKVHSLMKQQLSYFLPLYINKDHGSQIKREFQKMLADVRPFLLNGMPNASDFDVILQLIPNLMCSTVVEFSKGMKDTSENSLQGYFALHRLFLWMLENYPGLEARIEEKLSVFISNPLQRRKDNCPDIGQWLMLLSVSKKFAWTSVADAYLSECYKRNVMWYLQQDDKLSDPSTPQEYRLSRTFELTVISRNLLSFQVAFLKVARPDNMSMDEILNRYETNLGFPTPSMVQEMKTMCRKIESEIQDYADWYATLGLSVPSKDSLTNTLMESVKYAKATRGYHFKPKSHRR